MKNSSKGITLIALVVTIIVLIILAGVSINLVLGENGIITMAKRAKEDMEKAAQDEQLALDNLYMEMDNTAAYNESTKVVTANTGVSTKYATIYPYKSPESSTEDIAS